MASEVKKKIFFAMFACAFLLPCGMVYADGDSGSGNSGSGVQTNCSFPHAYQHVCDDDTGGASWHIYNTSSGPVWPTWDNQKILTSNEGGGDVAGTAKSTCAYAGYYIAFGWDGRKSSSDHSAVHYGIGGWNSGLFANTDYNSAGALKWDDIKDGDLSGYNGRRITSGAALKFYKKYVDDDGVTSIPTGTGWFCAEVQEYTLTAYAGVYGTYNSSTDTRTYLKSDGSTSTSSSGVWTNSATVSSGSNATVTTANFNPAGYTWHGWGSSCSSSTARPCTKNSLTSDTNVFAYYTKNGFSGRARVAEGTNWSGTTNTASTGWKTSDKTTSIDVNCPNAGCRVNFWLQLRADAGSGSTKYRTGTESNGGTTSWLPSASTWTSITPGDSDSPTFILGSNSNTGASVSLSPGGSACRYLKFYPYTTSGSTSKTVSACATAKVTTFQGKSSVSGTNAGTNTTDWKNTNTAQTGRITGCSSTSGCKVTFTHNMKITSAGGGSSDWTVTRTSNLITTTKAIAVNRGSSVSSGTYSDTTSGGRQVSTSGELTLWPGMVVCERLTFKPDNRSGTGNVYTQQCASAEGDAQPPCTDTCTPNCDTATDECDGDNDKDPSGANTLVNIKVKNGDVSAYGKYRKTVYAKPGDVLSYRAIYNPILQYTYFLKPQKMRINSGTIYPTSGVNTDSTLAAMFNLYKGSLAEWNNAYRVYSSNFTTAAFERNYTFANGGVNRSTEYNEHTVVASEVGRSLNEIAKTSANLATQTTPGQVSFTNSSDNNLGTVSTAAKQSTASALIPYNYINTTEVTKDTDDPLYAGETASIAFSIVTSPKLNNVTNGTYATIVRDAKWKLQISYFDPQTDGIAIMETTDKTGNLNSGYNLGGSTSAEAISINIPDVPAGTDFCVRSAVYPANSGADANWNNADGSGTWAYSGEKCFKVAKRPSIEVWGGNTYSRGAISLNDVIKNNLANYTDYLIEGFTSTDYVFGSWTELGLVASGTVKGLSSGASLGFTANNNGNLWPGYHPADGNGNNQNIAGKSPGGSDKKSLCNRSPLTFANTCRSGLVGSLGSATTASNANDDKSAIISKFIFGGSANIGDLSNVVLNNETNLREGTNIYYYNGGSSELTVPGGVVNKGTIQIVHSTSNITISGNLQYEDGYTDLGDIPKLIIYTENEIRIGCSVTRIDAVLIADSILTCDNVKDGTISNNNIEAKINDQINSNQLKVNGAIITGKLYPNRTYGAATGANSMVPAEIINFDPSLYTWGANAKSETVSSDAGSDESLDITYRKELAPRL